MIFCLTAMLTLGSGIPYRYGVSRACRADSIAWQTTPNVYDTSGNGSENTLPLALCSGDGSSMVSYVDAEKRGANL